MLIYCLKTCDTCRRALAALDAAGTGYDLRDVRKDGIAAADLAEIVAQNPAAALNKSSATWRGLSEADRARDAASLIAEHPTLMKRPAIKVGGQWTVGWGAEAQAKVLG